MKINKFALVEIERQKGAAIKIINGIDKTLKDRLLIETLPSGEPENDTIKLTRLDEQLFLTSLKLSSDEDYGIALIIQLDDVLIKKNPLGFVESMQKYLDDCLTKGFDDSVKTLEIQYYPRKNGVIHYKNFDSLIFAILTLQRVVILGEKSELTKTLTGIYDFVPTELKKHVSLVCNISHLVEGAVLQGVQISKDLLIELENKMNKYTIVVIPKREVYGFYTSPLCKKLAKLIQEEKTQDFKYELEQLLEKVTESSELPNLIEYSTNEHISVPDASLILWMRANYYNLEVPKEITEFM